MGTHKPIGVQQGIAARHPEMCRGLNLCAKPKGRIGFMALFNLFLPVHCPSSRIQKLSFHSTKENPNRAVHPQSSWLFLHPRGFYFLRWIRFVLASGWRFRVVLNLVCVSTHERCTSRSVRGLSLCQWLNQSWRYDTFLVQRLALVLFGLPSQFWVGMQVLVLAGGHSATSPRPHCFLGKQIQYSVF